MQWSHSRIDCFEKCKLKYKMRYLDSIETIPDTEPGNALILGTAVHTGIEKSLEEAIKEYAFSFPIITDEHINEIIKLEAVIPKARAAIPGGGQFEVPIFGKDFVGFIDYLVPVGKGEFDLYDFKYTKNPGMYRKSPQLSLYKYFYERYHPGTHIRNLAFVIVPKVSIKQRKDESVMDYRKRLKWELNKVEVSFVPMEFDNSAIVEFLLSIKAANEETEFPPTDSFLCRYCEFADYCKKGWNYFMKLPENKRRNIEAVSKRVIWMYGAPFCGKTTFANGFPDPLMLNTDGNIKYVDAPYIHIKDEVKVEGRMTKRTLAWEVFKDIVDELEKKDNDFKTIVVDLLEDLYEHCRLYMYQQMGITHESDDSFRAWDKVRGEFLHTLRRLMNLDYENIILISHEDMTKDITKKGGDKITAIKPNLQDKVAVKVAGMVDVVARVVADGDTRMFCFKSNEVIFGGGRLRVDAKDIPLDVDALFAVYDEANRNAASGAKPAAATTTKRNRAKVEEPAAEPSYKPVEPSKDEQAENNTPTEETPVNEPETPETEAAPETIEEAMNPPESAPEQAAETTGEKPRRKRKARD